MGRKDYRHRESKKAKKEAKKQVAVATVLQPPPEAEVIPKGKKAKPGGEEEEG